MGRPSKRDPQGSRPDPRGGSGARARKEAEIQAAARAVAAARGVGLQEALDTRMKEIERVREHARSRAEDYDTAVEEEVATAAEWIIRTERSEEPPTL